MTTQDIATALGRVEAMLRRRPQAGLQDDMPATARWQGGTRMLTSHANGTQIATDMPAKLAGRGGSGDQVTPGWLFRAGLASCAATSITLLAAAERIELGLLEVQACSRSDTRGLLGMRSADGRLVPSAPGELRLDVRIAANGVGAERLRALVETAVQRSPIPSLVPHRLSLQIAPA